MRQRRSTRKLNVYKRKSRKYKKPTRHVKRRNYRGGNYSEIDQQPLSIEDDKTFYLGKFKIDDSVSYFPKVLWSSTTFYIRFPKMIKVPTPENITRKIIPYYKYQGWDTFEIELYWSNGDATEDFLNRKLHKLVFLKDYWYRKKNRVIQKIGDIRNSITYGEDPEYKSTDIHNSIIPAINKFLNDENLELEEYSLEDYQRLESK